jgi:X-X-X-Leu-X-X-Gly heptad repeat protein
MTFGQLGEKMKKIPKFICKNKYIILIIALIMLIPAIVGMEKMKINYDILVYLPEDIETMKGEKILTDDFNMGAFSISIVENMSSKDLLKLENEIKQIDGVENVVSYADLTGTTIPKEMLPNEIVNKISKDNSDILVITFADSTSSEKTLEAVSQIKEKTKDCAKIGGMSAMVLDTKNLSDKEVVTYVSIAVVLCIIVLMLTLDSYIIPFILLGNIGIAILYNMGTNLFLGDISYITKAISAVLQLGVTTDFSIFLYKRYLKAKEECDNNEDAMCLAIKDTFTAVIGSSLTTVAGFLALCTMRLTLGKDIGIVMAKGVIWGVICVLTIFPSLILTFDKLIQKTAHKQLLPEFHGFKKFTIKNYKTIFIVFLLLAIPAYFGYRHTEVYYNLDRSLPADLDSSIANSELKDKYNIVSPEIILVSKDLKEDEIDEMVSRIKSLDGVDFVLSYNELKEEGFNDALLTEDTKKLFESDTYEAIIVNSTYNIATDELNNQINEMQSIIKQYDSKGILAGEGPLTNDLITISNKDFNDVNYTSIAVIFIIMLFVLKSYTLPIILVSTIEFAILINMGIPYYTGTTIPFIASIVIGTIQLGATIDYAILMTTKYLGERGSGKDKFEAIKIAMDHSVTSIMVSALCFFGATFGVAIYSKLEIISSLCTLISRGAIISMLVVIIILPSLLLMFDKIICKTTKGLKGANKNMKTNMKKAVACLLTGTMLFSAIPVNAATKDETIYSKRNSDGSLKSTIVDEHLNGTDEDITTLENIINVNNDDTYTKDGNTMKWTSSNVYYEGTTTEKLPIDMSITYKLDGKDISLDDLLGQSGKVTINIKYTNKDVHTVKVNNVYEKLYTPFVITTGTIIDNDINTDIEVTNGRIVSTGTKSIIMGISAPGLYESLGYEELNDLDEINITYNTTNFSLSSIYSVGTPKILNDSDITNFSKIDELYSNVDKLQTATNTIQSGSEELTNKLTELDAGIEQENVGIISAYQGVTQIKSSLEKSLESKSATLDNETLNNVALLATSNVEKNKTAIEKQAQENASKQIYKVDENGNYVLDANNQLQYSDTIISIGNQAKQQAIQTFMAKGIKDPTTLYCVGESAYNTAIETAKNIMLQTATTTAYNTAKEIAASTAKSVAEQTYETALKSTGTELATLDSALSELQTGLNKLQTGSSKITTGTSKLVEGSNTLYEGIKEYNKTGITPITNFINNDVKSGEDRVNALVDLANNYGTFDSKKSNVEGTTKIVFVVDSEKKAEEKKEDTSNTETKTSWWDHVKEFFTLNWLR